MTTSKAKSRKSSDYKEFLLKRLKNPEAAAGYLTASLQEGEQTFLLAVKDVAEACGGIGSLAKATNLNRQGLYDMLAEKGNPRFSSLSAILNALGIRVEFKPKFERAKTA